MTIGESAQRAAACWQEEERRRQDEEDHARLLAWQEAACERYIRQRDRLAATREAEFVVADCVSGEEFRIYGTLFNAIGRGARRYEQFVVRDPHSSDHIRVTCGLITHRHVL